MPPGPLTDSSEVVANYIYNMLNTVMNRQALSVQQTWYGDQVLLPQTPALCVAPGLKRREFQGASYRTLNMIETYVWVYYGKIQDIQANLHAAVALADAVETMVHSDLTLGGNVTAVLCTQDEPGVINKNGVWMMGARLTFQSISKTTFPAQVV